MTTIRTDEQILQILENLKKVSESELGEPFLAKNYKFILGEMAIERRRQMIQKRIKEINHIDFFKFLTLVLNEKKSTKKNKD